MTDQPLGGGEQAGSLSANFASLSQVCNKEQRVAVFVEGNETTDCCCVVDAGRLQFRQLAVTLASDVSCAFHLDRSIVLLFLLSLFILDFVRKRHIAASLCDAMRVELRSARPYHHGSASRQRTRTRCQRVGACFLPICHVDTACSSSMASTNLGTYCVRRRPLLLKLLHCIGCCPAPPV